MAEVALVLSLFIPYYTDANLRSDDPESVNLFFFLTGFSDPDNAIIALAFLLLILAIVGSICTLPILTGERVSTKAGNTVVTFVTLLLLGTAGAWLLIAMTILGENERSMEPAAPLLAVGALLAAMITFLPAYRSIWAR